MITPVDLRSILAPPGPRLAVRVTPDALRRIRGGHPWVFDSSIRSAPGTGRAGDLAVVFDDRRRFAAVGLWDPASPIRIKVLHHGEPRTVDAAFLDDRIAAALAVREPLVADRTTDGYRCVHGENDGLPGLVVDRYAGTLVVKLYSDAWLPWLADVVEVLVARLAPERVVLRLARGVTARPELPDGAVLLGRSPDRSRDAVVRFHEHGLVFDADVVRGQKTGHFLDQRDNRARVRDLASGASVLDVFACTGGFSVHAAAGGATRVLSVDLAAPALAAASRNMAANADRANVAACEHAVRRGDAFDVMTELGRRRERFGVVIVDPPSFARRAADVAGALRAYRRLASLAVALVEPGGVLVMASCSSRVTADAFHEIVDTAVFESGRRSRVIARTAHAVDHPIGFPEGAYLKAAFVRL